MFTSWGPTPDLAAGLGVYALVVIAERVWRGDPKGSTPVSIVTVTDPSDSTRPPGSLAPNVEAKTYAGDGLIRMETKVKTGQVEQPDMNSPRWTACIPTPAVQRIGGSGDRLRRASAGDVLSAEQPGCARATRGPGGPGGPPARPG